MHICTSVSASVCVCVLGLVIHHRGLFFCGLANGYSPGLAESRVGQRQGYQCIHFMHRIHHMHQMEKSWKLRSLLSSMHGPPPIAGSICSEFKALIGYLSIHGPVEVTWGWSWWDQDKDDPGTSVKGVCVWCVSLCPLTSPSPFKKYLSQPARQGEK